MDINNIGNTPIEAINLIINGVSRTVYLKLEGANPGGSLKDRTALSLVGDLEKQGLIHRDSILTDSTSGNLGVALSMIARAKGYRFIAIVDPKTTKEVLAKMEKLGAQTEMVSQKDNKGGYLLTRLERVRQLCKSSREFIWTNQYANEANPLAHYHGTGPEIYRQMGGEVGGVFIAVSTGGTLSGIGRYFREVSPSTRIIAVDACGSVVFGCKPGPRLLTGIGSSQVSNFITPGVYDEHMNISDEVAFSFCRYLFLKTGIKVGGSSGAVLAACGRYLATHPEVHRVVCVCPDHGRNYDNTIYNDDWLEQEALEISLSKLAPATDLLGGEHVSQN